MAPSPLDKQTGSCNSLHNWLMSLAIDLLCVICGSENGTNGHYLAAFSVDVVFACLPPCPPNRSASDIDYVSKKLSKIRGVATMAYKGVRSSEDPCSADTNLQIGHHI